METAQFISTLDAMSGADILGVASAVRFEHGTADGEVTWWKATVEISSVLRRDRRTRLAGRAAHDASSAVLAAATRAGLVPAKRDDVTVVARAASDVARGLVAGPSSAVESLLTPWAGLTLAAA